MAPSPRPFPAQPSNYAVGELGASYAAGDSETTTGQLNLTVDPALVPAGGNLVVGLSGGVSQRGSATAVSLNVTENGTPVAALSLSNDTAAQAKAAFTNMAFNLGVLSGSGRLALDFLLSVTTTGAGSDFYGGIIVSDPTSGPASAPHLHAESAESGLHAAITSDLSYGHAIPLLGLHPW